jgi:heterodisulfide reductase subunit C
MLKALLGFEEELVSPESEIWNCTNCYTCSERCPQDVRPVDVIIAIKNMCVAEGKAPDVVRGVCDSVLATGMTTKTTSLVDKRRTEFGLTPLQSHPVDELDKILRGEAS